MIKHQKNIIFAGDLNINVLDYESNKKVKHFLSSMFQHNMIPTINRPTRVTRNTATAIDHIITNTVISGIQHRSGIIKKVNQKKRHNLLTNASTERNKSSYFKHELSQIEWNNIIKALNNPNTAYKNFFDKFFKTYGKYFPKVRI